ncbi:MAG: DUF4476 domain-containing protein [Deltaproteobacteria bacterium]|nr:MAG: DUF4476 domain-containing protein [Deltaproteobacteria bacterium]
MRTLARLFQWASLAAVLAAPLAASAQPDQLTVHDPFFEPGRFMTRNLQLNGGGNSLVVERGGQVVGTLDIKQRCERCGPGANQIIVGLAGDTRAQACVWNGGARSRGWESVRFALQVPDVPGIYEVRVSGAQAKSCRGAEQWWTRGGGAPNGDSTIGVIVVQGAPAPPPSDRHWRAIMRDIDRTTGDLDDLSEKLRRVTEGRKMNRRDEDDARAYSRQIADLVQTLDALHGELDDAVAQALHETRRDDRPGRRRGPRRFVQPQIVVVAAPDVVEGPMAMAPDTYSRLLARIDDAAFPDAQLKALRDAIHADGWFLTSQAVGILKHFSFDNHKVDAAAMMCPRIVEPGALPELMAAFDFESYRDQLREKTHNRCGYMP